MRRFLGMVVLSLSVLGFGCGPSSGAVDGPASPTEVPTKCEGAQPVIQEVRWLGTAASPGKAPIGGIPAEVGKPVAMEDGIGIVARQVKYTPISEDSNMAIARVMVSRGGEEKELNLSRQLPSGVVCYHQISGLWIGLVETVPNKAMVRVGVPLPPPAAPPATPPAAPPAGK
jgi:hypothetical protein